MDQPVEPAEQPTCSICQGEFRDPKLLPCCHTFCAKCLEGLVTIKRQAEPTTYGGLSFSNFDFHSSGLRQVRDEISITCPQCTTRHILSAQGGVHSLLTDYTVIQEQERQQWKDLLQSKDTCGMCEQDGGTIVSFCVDCECFLCSYCAGAHRRMKVFSSHHVSSLSSPEFQNIKPKPKPVTCQIHPECSVNFYCATCCQLICNECVATEGTEKITSTIASDQVPKGVHRAHVLHMLTENHLTSLEDKLCHLLTSVSTRKEELQKDLVSAEDMEKESASHTEQLKKALVEQMERHIKQLQEQCEHDLKQIDENYAANLEDYRAKKSTLKEKISKFSMKEKFASKAQSCNGRIPKIAMIAKTASELEKSEALSRESSLSSSYEFGCALNKLPLVVRSLSKEIKSGLTQNIEGHDFTCSTSESTKSTPVKFKLGTKSQVTIKSSVQPVGTPQFKVIYGQSRRILKSTVQPAGAGSWLLECTPTCIATHKIEVCVFGHWISFDLPTVAVEGVLKEGDIVRRGPDPKSTAKNFLQTKGEDIKMAPQYETGKLTKVTHSYSLSGLSSKYELEITWGHESAKPLVEQMPSSAWNETLGFPIELAL